MTCKYLISGDICVILRIEIVLESGITKHDFKHPMIFLHKVEVLYMFDNRWC
jgi:hypothetical protein